MINSLKVDPDILNIKENTNKGKKNTILILIAILVIAILIVLYILLVFTTDVLKSNKEIFFNSLEKNISNANGFIDEDINNFLKKLDSNNYNISSTYNVVGKLNQNNTSLQALNDGKIKIESKVDNVNNKSEKNVTYNFGDEQYRVDVIRKQDNIYFNFVDSISKTIKMDGVGINNLYQYFNIENSSLLPNSLIYHLPKENLFEIIQKDIEDVLKQKVEKEKYQKVEDGNSEGIAILISSDKFNEIIEECLSKVSNDDNFLFALQQINSEITKDQVVNLGTILKQKAQDIFNQTGKEANIIIFQTGDKKDTIEIRYADKYLILLELKGSSIEIKINDYDISIKKEIDINANETKYVLKSNFLGYIIEGDLTFVDVAKNDQPQINMYFSFGNGNTKSISYQLSSKYVFENNIEITDIDEENLLELSLTNKNELDKNLSIIIDIENKYITKKLSDANMTSQYNPVVLSLPYVFIKEGILNNNLAKYKLENESNEEQQNEQERLEQALREDIQNRNNDYKNYTYEMQDKQSTQNLVNKVIENNKKYKNNDEYTIDIYTYYPDNFEKGQGNFVSAYSDEEKYVDDGQYMVEIVYENDEIKYIVLTKEEQDNYEEEQENQDEQNEQE